MHFGKHFVGITTLFFQSSRHIYTENNQKLLRLFELGHVNTNFDKVLISLIVENGIDIISARRRYWQFLFHLLYNNVSYFSTAYGLLTAYLIEAGEFWFALIYHFFISISLTAVYCVLSMGGQNIIWEIYLQTVGSIFLITWWNLVSSRVMPVNEKIGSIWVNLNWGFFDQKGGSLWRLNEGLISLLFENWFCYVETCFNIGYCGIRLSGWCCVFVDKAWGWFPFAMFVKSRLFRFGCMFNIRGHQLNVFPIPAIFFPFHNTYPLFSKSIIKRKQIRKG